MYVGMHANNVPCISVYTCTNLHGLLPKKASTSLLETQTPHRRETDLKTRELQCSAQFLAGESFKQQARSESLMQRQRHVWSSVTLKFQANDLPPPACQPAPLHLPPARNEAM